MPWLLLLLLLVLINSKGVHGQGSAVSVVISYGRSIVQVGLSHSRAFMPLKQHMTYV